MDTELEVYEQRLKNESDFSLRRLLNGLETENHRIQAELRRNEAERTLLMREYARRLVERQEAEK